MQVNATAADSAEGSVRSSNAALGTFVALFTCLFLFKEGHSIAARDGKLMPIPGRQGRRLFDQAATTIRRYFVGLTVLGVFCAVVVVVGALILDVPPPGSPAHRASGRHARRRSRWPLP